MHCYASAFENGEAALLTSIRSCVVVESLTFQVASLRAVVIRWAGVILDRLFLGSVPAALQLSLTIAFQGRSGRVYSSPLHTAVKASPLFSVSWKSVWLITRKEFNQTRTILGIVMASGCVRRLYFMRSDFASLTLFGCHSKYRCLWRLSLLSLETVM